MDLTAFTSVLTAAGLAPEAAHSPSAGVHAATVRRDGVDLTVRWYNPAVWSVTGAWSALPVDGDELVPFDADTPEAAVAGILPEARQLLLGRVHEVLVGNADAERLRPLLEAWFVPCTDERLRRNTFYLVLDGLTGIHGALLRKDNGEAQLRAASLLGALENAVRRNRLEQGDVDFGVIWGVLAAIPEQARPVIRQRAAAEAK